MKAGKIPESAVKEICQKAGVNRSTFYLHYENISDLFNETVESLTNEFQNSFAVKDVSKTLNKNQPEELVFIKPEFLVPYLEFVKRNKRVLKMIHNKPLIFNNDAIYKKMRDEIFLPALFKFNIPPNESVYKLEFFTRGVAAIISKWLELDCEDSIDNIVKLIIDCVGFSRN